MSSASQWARVAIPDQPGVAHDEHGPEDQPGPLVAPEDLVELDAAPAPAAPPTGSPITAGHRPRRRQRLRAAVVPAFVVALVLLGATILVSASWRSEPTRARRSSCWRPAAPCP